MSKDVFLKNNQKCVYLDQFAVGNIASSSPYKLWGEIRRLLEEGVENNKFICPRSMEHFLETSKRGRIEAIQQDNFFKTLSNGWCFRPEVFITSELLIYKARNQTPNKYTYIEQKPNITFEDLETINNYETRRDKLGNMIDESVKVSNEIRDLQKNDKIDLGLVSQFFSAHKELSKISFLNRLQKLIKDKFIEYEFINFRAEKVPFWADYVIHVLLKKHHMKSNELKALFSHIQKYGFSEIPTLDIRFSLEAFHAVHQRKEYLNDQIDIMRTATGLPMSDIYLTDSAKKSAIIELGFDKKYSSKIFCGKEKDLELLIVNLCEILS